MVKKDNFVQIDVDEKEVGIRWIDFSIETLAREEILLWSETSALQNTF